MRRAIAGNGSTSFLRRDRLRGFTLRIRAAAPRDTIRMGRNLVHARLHVPSRPRRRSLVPDPVARSVRGLRGVARLSPAPRPEPPDYERYIRWLGERDFEPADAFWRELLAGISAPTPLVVDRMADDDLATYQHGERWDGVGASVSVRLRTIAAEHDLTTNTIVMGAWAILLHRYSGESDVVFGATRACRKSSVPDADQTIGLFINTVPVRVALMSGQSALEAFKAVRRQWISMRPYEHTPLARVKAASRVPASQPLFETLLVFENFRLDAVMKEIGGAWSARTVELHELTNFPITLAAYDGDELTFKIEFDRRRLTEDTVDRMLAHLRTLLQAIAADPQMSVDRLLLLPDSERRQLLDDFNRPQTPPESGSLPLDGNATLASLFEARASHSPDALALTCDGQSLSYAELNGRANRVARTLIDYGVAPDTLVGLCMDRSSDLVTAVLAILKAGGAYLPIDLAYPADRVAFMLEDAQAPVLLTQRALAGQLPATAARIVCIEDVLEHSSTSLADGNPTTAATGPTTSPT